MQVAPDHPAFAGHFPGQPLLPGVTLLAEVLETVQRQPELAARVGGAPQLGVVKFLAPVRPGASLSFHFEPTATAVRFEVRSGERVMASGHFETVS